MSGFTGNLTAINAYARQYMDNLLKSSVYPNAGPLLAAMAGQGEDPDQLGRPGEAAVLGSYGRQMSSAERKSLTSRELVFPIAYLNGNNLSDGGAAWIVPGSSNPSAYVKEENKVSTFKFYWSLLQQSVEVDQLTVQTAQGPYEVLNPFKTAMEQALAQHVESWATAFWYDVNNTPVQPANSPYLEGFVGMPQALIGTGATVGSTTSSTYGGVDLSQSDTSNVRGTRVTSATAATLSLVDDANLNQGARIYGNGVDLMVTTTSIYQTLKSQAREQGVVPVTVLKANEDLQEFGRVSFKNEVVLFGKTAITYDAHCPAGYLAALTVDSWTCLTQPGKNFSFTPFEKLQIPGQPKIFYAAIETAMALVCRKPRLNVLYTSVS